MSDKKDQTDQQQQPADEESRRPRYVPFPQIRDMYFGPRGLYRAVSAVPVQPTSAERTRQGIHTFPFDRSPTRDELTVHGVRATAVPSTYVRSRTPGYSHAPRQSLPPLPTPLESPRSSVSSVPGSGPDSGRVGTASGGPPPYWQHIGEPSMLCTPPREINNFPSVGRRSTMLPLPPIRDIFSPGSDGPLSERVDLPPLFLKPSVFCHMRGADPRSAVDTQTGPRLSSKSPDADRSHGSGGDREPQRERAHEESAASSANPTPTPTPTPTPSAPARATDTRQIAESPEATQSDAKTPDSSAQLTNFQAVEAHTAKCDLCDKRNTQGMTRCAECGWQTCNACTIKNNCFRSHRVGRVVHIGPIDKKDLPTAASMKKAKQAAKRKREDPDYVPEPERGGKKKRATKSQVRTTDHTSMSSSSSDGNPNEGDYADLSDMATVILAARNLQALSLEAFEMDARARARMIDQRWNDGLWVRSDDDGSRDEDDETEPENLDEAGGLFGRCIPSLRQEALKVASKEAHYYIRGEMRKLNPSARTWEETSESESEPNDGKVKTRAQTYARKRPAY